MIKLTARSFKNWEITSYLSILEIDKRHRHRAAKDHIQRLPL